eukprot:881167-Pleurochrysis_carterae.AAC.2
MSPETCARGNVAALFRCGFPIIYAANDAMILSTDASVIYADRSCLAALINERAKSAYCAS